MKQYFIKIHPKFLSVSYGFLLQKKYSRTKLQYVNKRPIEYSDINTALAWIKNDCPENTKAIFFLHGLAGTRPLFFSRNSNVFKKDYFQNTNENNKVIIHILWNNGEILYRKNIKIISKSTNSLSNVLNNINTTFPVASLMCQSMGNRMLFETIVNLKVKVCFEELLLIAPDINLDEFIAKNSILKEIAKKIFVFYHKKDRVLKLSSRFNKKEILGRYNVDTDGIDFIDCTQTKPKNILNHMYFMYCDFVKDTINNIIK